MGRIAKNTNKQEKKEDKKFNSYISITLTAWELKELKNCDKIRCSCYGGKDAKGGYKKSPNVDVLVNDSTNTDKFKFEEKGKIDVNGNVAIEYSEDGKYLNITIFADTVQNH